MIPGFQDLIVGGTDMSLVAFQGMDYFEGCSNSIFLRSYVLFLYHQRLSKFFHDLKCSIIFCGQKDLCCSVISSCKKWLKSNDRKFVVVKLSHPFTLV